MPRQALLHPGAARPARSGLRRSAGSGDASVPASETGRQLPSDLATAQLHPDDKSSSRRRRTCALVSPSVTPRQWLGAAAVLVAISVAGVLVVRQRAGDPDPSIAVLPFVNLSGDAHNEYFSDGLTEEVIYRLSAIPGLKVISRTSAMYYKGSGKPLREIAGALGVAHILEGTVRQSAASLRISAQLFDVAANEHLWAETYDYARGDIFRVQEELARKVAQALALELGERTNRLLARRGTADPEAYELYRRGRFFWNLRTREGHEQAIEHFDRAIARDSAYADAYGGLADVYLTDYQLNISGRPESEAYTRLKEAAERALALDDESADAHTSVAIALWWQRDWRGADRELRRAIELNPGSAIAHSWYSLLLRGMGRAAQALEESRRAAELDPFSVVASYNYGWQCHLDRDYDCALEQYGNAIEVGEYPSAYRGLALVYAHKGMAREALHAPTASNAIPTATKATRVPTRPEALRAAD